MPVEIVNLRLLAWIEQRRFHLPKQVAQEREARKGRRQAWDARTGIFREFDVFDRYRIGVGSRLTGPLIVEERESTTVVGSDDRVEMDAYGILHITLSGRTP
jgi:N-methylhydantoinase A/oxoprolinase/acetone carboxylase beta subunit